MPHNHIYSFHLDSRLDPSTVDDNSVSTINTDNHSMCPTFSGSNYWSADFYCSLLWSSRLTRAWSTVDHRQTASSTLIFVGTTHRVWSGSRHATNSVDPLYSDRVSLGYFPRTRDDTVEYSWSSSLPSPVNRSDDEYVQQSNRIRIERS